MGAVPRRNKLARARSESLEYAVHGKWRRENDANGEFGCWHVGVRQLVEAFGGAAVREKLAAFAAAHATAREEAIVAAEAAIAAEAAGEDEEAAAPA